MATEKERHESTTPEERKVSARTPVESRPPPTAEVQDGLAQLREILLGGTVRDLERRVARAEAHMTSRANEIELESRRRMEMIESHLRKESDALTSRLERELVQTNEAVRSVTREHRESISAVDQRGAKLEDAIMRAQREVREQLLQQAKRFLDELQSLRREVIETLERELEHADVGFEQGRYAEDEHASP
jgi:hypothetical protein